MTSPSSTTEKPTALQALRLMRSLFDEHGEIALRGVDRYERIDAALDTADAAECYRLKYEALLAAHPTPTAATYDQAKARGECTEPVDITKPAKRHADRCRVDCVGQGTSLINGRNGCFGRNFRVPAHEAYLWDDWRCDETGPAHRGGE